MIAATRLQATARGGSARRMRIMAKADAAAARERAAAAIQAPTAGARRGASRRSSRRPRPDAAARRRRQRRGTGGQGAVRSPAAAGGGLGGALGGGLAKAVAMARQQAVELPTFSPSSSTRPTAPMVVSTSTTRRRARAGQLDAPCLEASLHFSLLDRSGAGRATGRRAALLRRRCVRPRHVAVAARPFADRPLPCAAEPV